jgi:hypothetical protein
MPYLYQHNCENLKSCERLFWCGLTATRHGIALGSENNSFLILAKKLTFRLRHYCLRGQVTSRGSFGGGGKTEGDRFTK